MENETKMILSAIDAADFLRIEGPSRRSRLKKIWWLCSQRRLPHYRSATGRHLYFKRDELEAWALAVRVRTNEQLSSEAESFVNR